MKWNNKLTEILNIQYPIIQAPMLGITTPEMVAEISNLDGLGSLPVGGLSPEQTLSLIQKTKELTQKKFAVNLFVHDISVPDQKETDEMQFFLQQLTAQNNIQIEKQNVESFRFYSYKEQIDILIKEKIPVVSFTFGIPDSNSIKKLKENGTILIGTATSMEEAILLDKSEIDIITAQGTEAGGHRGTFLDNEPFPLIGLNTLVSLITDHIDRPVLAAGGIYNGKTIRSAFLSGAKGVQIGSAFIASDESAATTSYKKAVLRSKETDSVLTKTFSGRWARGIKNKFIEEMEKYTHPVPPFPIQNSLTTPLRAIARQQDNVDFISLWAGQSAFRAKEKPVAVLFRELIRETEEIK